MEFGRTMCFNIIPALLLSVTVTAANPTNGLASSKITIGGVVFTDLSDPVRSGLEGVTVTITGNGMTLDATTGGIIGLWKVDVPEGTYTVTPRKKDYLIEHFIGIGSDGQRSITIEVTPETMAANQSIRFLAMEWPEEEEEEEQHALSESPDAGQTGGGCAMVRGQQSRIRDFVAPYAACCCILFVMTRIDSRGRYHHSHGRGHFRKR